MLDPKAVEEVMETLRRAVPSGFTQDIEKNLRAALTAALGRLDLVTREELDVQSAVLARTRARLEALEKQVAELETLLRK
jgi:BMFP domain-containing protein YqiC